MGNCCCSYATLQQCKVQCEGKCFLVNKLQFYWKLFVQSYFFNFPLLTSYKFHQHDYYIEIHSKTSFPFFSHNVIDLQFHVVLLAFSRRKYLHFMFLVVVPCYLFLNFERWLLTKLLRIWTVRMLTLFVCTVSWFIYLV